MSRPFAVFDIDGTLARCSLYTSLVQFLLENYALSDGVHDRIKDLHNLWLTRTSDNSYVDYELSIIDAWELLQHEITYTEFKRFAKEVYESLKDLNYTYTRDLIQELRAKGYFIVALSGSPQEIIDLIVEYHNLDLGVGSTFFTEEDRFTGESIIVPRQKGEMLKKIVADYDLDLGDSIAIGDTVSDIPMLELTSNPIAFNPEKQLKEKAIQEQWTIVVERKNSIYSLIPTGDSHRLEF